jgi:Putative zinc-finger
MTHAHHDDVWTDRLSDYIDDELPADERQRVGEHLSVCAECRQAVSELSAVAGRARSLSDLPPDRDLWPGVAGRIGAPPRAHSGVLEPAALKGSATGLRTERRFSFTLPQLVAAALALMVLSGGMVWIARLGGDRTDFPGVAAVTESDVEPPGAAVRATFTEAHYDEAIADLKGALDAGRAKLDANTVRILEENLRAIDQAIEQSRTALATDPANVYLSDHLVAAKKRKLALLRRANALAASGTTGL